MSWLNIATDDFNRADGGIWVGQANWHSSPSFGMPFIVGNQVKLIGDPASWTPCNDPRQYSKMTWKAYGTSVPAQTTINSGVGVLMSYPGSVMTGYLFAHGSDGTYGTGRKLYKMTFATTSVIYVDAVAGVAGDRFALYAEVTTSSVILTGTVNDIQVFSLTDTASDRLTTGQVGIACGTVGGFAYHMWDDWEGGWGVAPVAVFNIDLDAPVRHTMKMANLVADFGDGYEQRGNKNSAYSHADGEGGVTSYKGRNRFEITMDMLQHVNGDSSKMANRLWNFYKARLGSYEAFYFYNPAEASIADPTGISTTGRYLVRFEQADLTREHFALYLFRAGIALLEVRA